MAMALNAADCGCFAIPQKVVFTLSIREANPKFLIIFPHFIVVHGVLWKAVAISLICRGLGNRSACQLLNSKLVHGIIVV